MIRKDINPQKNRIKNFIVNAGFVLLGRGLESCSYFDQKTKNELNQLPDNFSFTMLVLPQVPAISLRYINKRLKYLGLKETTNPDLIICIKNLNTAFKLITTQIGTHKVYAEHKISVHGNVSYSMIITRLMYRVQELLFPKFLHKNILKRSPPLSLKRMRDQIHIYTLGILFKR